MIARLLSSAFAPYFCYAGVTALAAALGWGGWLNWQLDKKTAETVEIRNAMAVERAISTAAALAQTEANRAEETRRSIQLQKAADDADRKLSAARADAGAASAAAGRLSERIAAVVAASRQAACNPAVASIGTPAADPASLLADLFRQSDERAGQLAAIADARGIAGAACEAAYSSLRTEQVASP